MVTYYNKTGAKVSDYFTGTWQYEAQFESQIESQIEIKPNIPFNAYLYIRKDDSEDESKITSKVLIDGKVVQEGSSTAWSGVSCNYTVE